MILEFFVLGIVLIFTLFYHVNKRPPNYAPVARISFPILGHFPYFSKYEKVGLYRLFMEWGHQCNSAIIGVDFANTRAVVLNDQKLIKQAFSLPALSGRLHGRAMSVRGGDDGINRGVIFADGVHWTEQRRFCIRHLKEFGFGKKSMENVIITEAEDLVNGLKRDAGKPVSTTTRFNAAVVNSFWQICAGERFNHDDPKLAELVTAIIQNIQGSKALGTLIFMPWFCRLFPKLSGWDTYEENFRTMENFISKFVESRMAKHELGANNDFIDVYINEMKSCTDSTSSFYGEEGKKNILNTLGDIFVASSETTSTNMSWISLYLALHPDIQEKVHKEIHQIIGYERLPTLSDRDSMPYTCAVIQETLRLSSVVPMGVFHRATEDVMFNEIYIPKDTIVISNIYGASHNSASWGNESDDFKPERFLSADMRETINSEGVIAFSASRRICIGEALARNELFLFTTAILQIFQIQIDPKSPRPTMVANFGGTVAGPLPHNLIFVERLQSH